MIRSGVADGSQPLHVTVQYNGWTGPNPNGYTTEHKIHSQFETAYVDAVVSESEVQAILAEARPHERALIGLLCFTGLRPGEAYALDWSAVDLKAGALRVVRSWDYRGRKFVEPKTKAGARIVPLSGWLVAELTAHQERERLRVTARR